MVGLPSHTTPDARGTGSRTRALDTAEGVLIGLRRIPATDAFDELVSAARRHGMSVFTLAEALVALASGNECTEPATARAAHAEWGALFRP